MSCDYSKLRGRIKEIYGTQDRFAEAIGIGRVSLSKRLQGKLDFSSSEITKSIAVLKINENDIGEFFFKVKV